jgi:hypothetical protein
VAHLGRRQFIALAGTSDRHLHVEAGRVEPRLALVGGAVPDPSMPHLLAHEVEPVMGVPPELEVRGQPSRRGLCLGVRRGRRRRCSRFGRRLRRGPANRRRVAATRCNAHGEYEDER